MRDAVTPQARSSSRRRGPRSRARAGRRPAGARHRRAPRRASHAAQLDPEAASGPAPGACAHGRPRRRHASRETRSAHRRRGITPTRRSRGRQADRRRPRRRLVRACGAARRTRAPPASASPGRRRRPALAHLGGPDVHAIGDCAQGRAAVVERGARTRAAPLGWDQAGGRRMARARCPRPAPTPRRRRAARGTRPLRDRLKAAQSTSIGEHGSADARRRTTPAVMRCSPAPTRPGRYAKLVCLRTASRPGPSCVGARPSPLTRLYDTDVAVPATGRWPPMRGRGREASPGRRSHRKLATA